MLWNKQGCGKFDFKTDTKNNVLDTKNDAIPCPLPPVVAKVCYSQNHNRRCHISPAYMNHQAPKVSLEELLLSRPICYKLFRLHCHGRSLLPSYLHRISWKENSACSARGHHLQNLNHLLLDCPVSELLRKSILALSLYS